MKRYAIALIAAAAFAVGCGSDDADIINNPNSGVSFRQVEQLARPAINEGFLFTNSFLNTYNAVGPAFIAAALANPAGPEGQAAAPVLAQAQTVIGLIIGVPGQTGAITTTAAAVGAFLPDVMRINADLAIPVATPAYSLANLNTSLSPIAGRKLTDDVVDVTYQALLDAIPAAGTDNVPYYAPPGNTNPNIGHNRLNGQGADFGTATFPFLAPAN